MSIRAERWVRERLAQVKVGPVAAAVLKELAYRHNQETGRCDPSVAGLAADTQLCERSVRVALRALEAAKLLRTVERKERSGRGKKNLRNRYSFPGMPLFGRLSSGAGDAGGVGQEMPPNLEVRAPSCFDDLVMLMDDGEGA